MLTFKNYLTEIKLNPKTIITPVADSYKLYAVTIKLTTGEIFSLSASQTEWYPDEVEIPQPVGYLDWEIIFVDEKESSETTAVGGKQALELFAAIEHVIKKFVKDYDPEVIRFSGKGKSKTKLYTLLARKMAKSGYYRLSKKEVKFLDFDAVSNTELLFRKDIWAALKKENPDEF